jgi:hypothetical protein
MGEKDVRFFVQKGIMDLRGFPARGREFGNRPLIKDFEPEFLQVLDAFCEVSSFFGERARDNGVYGFQPILRMISLHIRTGDGLNGSLIYYD